MSSVILATSPSLIFIIKHINILTVRLNNSQCCILCYSVASQSLSGIEEMTFDPNTIPETREPALLKQPQHYSHLDGLF